MFKGIKFIIIFVSLEKLLLVNGLDQNNKRGLLDYGFFPFEMFLHFAKYIKHEKADSILPESYMNTVELIESRGYRAERHFITTPDGCTIEIHRILSPNCMSLLINQPPIIIQPGILETSSAWVLNLPNQSLGFILADACFDVWLSNSRGNVYGNKHERLHIESQEFWNFTFEDLALNELPCVIDYVLGATNCTQINYIAHSMGTTMGFVLLSMKPEYNHKVKMFVGMSPVAYLTHIKSAILRMFANFYKATASVWSILGSRKYFPSSPPEHILDDLCIPNSQPCINFLGQITGPDPNQLNTSRMSVYIHHLLQKTSVKLLIHYGQIFHSKSFQRFDLGRRGNRLFYKQNTPPLYPLENITTKIIFFCGKNDYISDIEDTKQLSQRLPGHKETHIVNNSDFNHMDFITGINASDLVYNNIKRKLLDYA